MYGDALTTKERVKDRLSISTTDFDDLIDNLILAVTDRIQQMTGRRFIQATYTNEMHDGSDLFGSQRSIIILKNGPVQSVASLEYKAGLTTTPNWTTLQQDWYDVDIENGMIHHHGVLPRGRRNLRVTYTGGFSGYSLGISNFWLFNVVPTGAVNGVNLTFTLPEAADQVIVYVDGMREIASNVTFTTGGTSFTLASGRAPFSTIAVDYKRTVGSGDPDQSNLPADLVDVCERAVVHLFKKRESEGKKTESFQESSITWQKGIFDIEMLATIRNYRRGYNI